MKRLFNPLFYSGVLGLLVLFLFSACTNDETVGVKTEIDLTFSVKVAPLSSSSSNSRWELGLSDEILEEGIPSCDIGIAQKVHLTIVKDVTNEPVFDGQLDVTSYENGTYTDPPLQVLPGDYLITKFLVLSDIETDDIQAPVPVMGIPVYINDGDDSGINYGQFVGEGNWLPMPVSIGNQQKIEKELTVVCFESFDEPEFGFVETFFDVAAARNVYFFSNACNCESGHIIGSQEVRIYDDQDNLLAETKRGEPAVQGLVSLRIPNRNLYDGIFKAEVIVEGRKFISTFTHASLDELEDSGDGYIHTTVGCANNGVEGAELLGCEENILGSYSNISQFKNSNWKFYKYNNRSNGPFDFNCDEGDGQIEISENGEASLVIDWTDEFLGDRKGEVRKTHHLYLYDVCVDGDQPQEVNVLVTASNLKDGEKIKPSLCVFSCDNRLVAENFVSFNNGKIGNEDGAVLMQIRELLPGQKVALYFNGKKSVKVKWSNLSICPVPTQSN